MKRAFTMVELLVVIAIIAILAAILFPVFARAKAAAKQTACLSNLKQIGNAITMYMQDYDDVFPHALDASDKWAPQIWSAFPDFQNEIPHMPLLCEVLQPYCKSKEIFHCPSDDGTLFLDNHWPERLPSAPSLYSVYQSSYFFRTEIAFRAFTDTRFQLPAQVNVMFDGAGHWHSAARRISDGDDGMTVFELLRDYRYNCLYGDMHAKSVTFDTLQQAWETQL